jgi:pimeloyl-ACP methyl ester carboxylesterase
MKMHFQDPTFSFEFLRMLSAVIGGGSDINECFLTASRITEGDVESWHREWNRTAERIHGIAEHCLARGHRVSACEAYLRASNYYRSAEFFLHLNYEQPDPRALPTYQKSVQCFRQATRLFPFPCEEVSIPYEGTVLPGYFYRVDDSATPRPTLLLHGGFDSTGEELYFGTVPAALQRGYNCLIFEGPGQGSVIRLQHLPFRPDWEHVVTPVVDYALTRPEVDPRQLILDGHSLGGYLAPRAAAFEHRLVACIAIDGLFSFAPDRFSEALEQLSSEEEINEHFEQEMQQSLHMRWALSQGMWTLQASSPLDCMQKMAQYTLTGVAQQITCPTLVCDAESDHFFAGQPKMLYDALSCPKTHLLFTADDAAEEHGHAGAALLLNQRVFDWLDETLR